MNRTLRNRAWFTTLAFLFAISLNAQNYCSHNGCAGVKCMGIIGLEEQHDSFIPPPANFDPQGERDVVISVTYNGFTTAAQNAFQYAVDIWASLLTSDVPILLDATWENIDGNTLGFAGPVTFFQNFNNAPETNVYYPVALANKLAGFDLYPADADITASFDSGTNWYFGTDGNPGVGQYDFVTVVLHELGHGLGVTGSPTVDDGIGYYQLGNPIVYDTFVENGGGDFLLGFADNSTALANQLTGGNLFFTGSTAIGGNGGFGAELYAPSSWQGGSSFSHLDENSFGVGNANSLMTPFVAQGEAIHTPGPVILGLMADIGWTVNETGGGECSGLSMAITQGECLDTGDGLGELPVMDFVFNFIGNCTVEDFCSQEDGAGYDCFDLPGLGIDISAGEGIFFSNTTPGAFYQFYFTLSDGSTSSVFSWTNGDCAGGGETICDCQGNEHTLGVLDWLGDTFLDDGSYDWEGLPVFFDCDTWGNDCGDGGVTGDPFGVCLGNLPPNNGCGGGEETICDCQGNEHTLGVLDWLGDTFLDDGSYDWEGLPVYFDCDTWGNDCGDGGVTGDPFGVCLGNLPPNNGCAGGDIFGCTDQTATNYNPNATIDDGSCIYDNCSNLTLALSQGDCFDSGDGLGILPVIELIFNFTGDCSVEDFCYQENGEGFTCVNLLDLGIILASGDPLDFTNTNPGATYDFYYVLTDGTTSAEYTWQNGNCASGETICDCQGNEHTLGVLDWLGDTFLDDGSYDWEGLPVFFDCQTWGYDCGDAGIADDPFGVCLGNLPPNNGCAGEDIFGCTDQTATNYNPNATLDDGSCIYDNCSNLTLALSQGDCFDSGDGLGVLPVIELIFNFTGDCSVEDFCYQENGEGFTCVNLLDLGIILASGDPLDFTDTNPGATYDFYYVLTDGTTSDEYTWQNGNCANQETICDCLGTEHTVGVLVWLGDGVLDDGTYLWNDQPVDFNCATWGYDCGDGDLTGDPFGVCLGNLPPNNGCESTIIGCTDPLATNYNPAATIDDGSCFFGDCATGTLMLEQDCFLDEETMEIIPRILVNAETIGDCFVEEVCVQLVGGAETCYFLPDFDILIGNDNGGVFLTVDGPGEYVVYFTTADDISDPMTIFIDCSDAVLGCGNPFALNYSPLVDVNIEAECIYDVYICDCAGTQHSGGALVWLGDTFLDDGTYSWQGQPVDFNCETWGYDCGDGDLVGDPFGVCEGNLPPNNGCDDDTCGPLGMVVFQEDCLDNGDGLLPVIGFEFSINGDCIVEDFCFIENGGDPVCFNLPTLEEPIILTDGDELILTEAVPGATYEFYYTTSDGSQSGVFTWVNGDCTNEETICDCDGNQHTIGVLNWLGDTFLDDGSFEWDGQTVNFDCITWGFDCGDGGVINDPNGVCDGNLPPNNGCVNEVLGCTDPLALNYNPNATVNDGSCFYNNPGCTDTFACNYDEDATLNDGTCNYDCYGCTDPTADNYNPNATIDNGSCIFSNSGCTDALACNFDPNAIMNDGSCNYDCYGCTDVEAVNYNPNATIDNGSCIYEEIGGCIYIAACNYDPNATVDDGSCDFDCYGCTDPEATNYDPDATIENGDCIYGDIEGCMDVEACNYDVFATIDDGSCNFDCYGCTDEEAVNYDAEATIDDGSCIYDIEGCTDEEATNYNSEATLDDGSCIYDCEYPTLEYTVIECSDDADALYFVEVVISDLGNGAPYTISNDQNGDEVSLNFTGTIQVGPFNEGENVLLTVSSDQMTNCVITSPVLSCEVSVAELNGGAIWEVYPNPANAWLTIKGNTSETVLVDLIDVTGQLVKQVQLKTGNIENRMNVGDVASGVYFIRLNYADQVITQKVTIRH
ncbi:MAG: hypothetical protein ACI93E_001251 [Flavobacteriales bacterium]|jgi:hypothetical protein